MRDLKTIMGGIKGRNVMPMPDDDTPPSNRSHVETPAPLVRGMRRCILCGVWFKIKAIQGGVCQACKPEQARLQKLFPAQHTRITPEIAIKLREMAADGIFIPEMHKETGLDRATIRAHLQYHKIEYQLKYKSAPRLSQEKIGAIKKRFIKLRRRLNQGDARKSVAKQFDVSMATISRHTSGIKIEGGAK